MTFTSLEFLVFLPIVLAFNLISKGRFKKIILIILSLYFYMTTMRQYVTALVIVIVLIYFSAIIIDKYRNKNAGRLLYLFSLISSILFLLFFKYYFDFSSWLLCVLGKKILPVYEPFTFIGISFVIFQITGYLYDVYHENVSAENNILNFSLFVLFFPKLISGPIEKAKTFLPQIVLNEVRGFNADDFIKGLKVFVFGFFAKVVIANRLDPAVNNVFANPSDFNTPQNLLAALFFTFQLYSDFMGYSFMAVGISKMLGYNIINNFYLPLFSVSISDFWKRWHISLSNWFRDYLFLPLNYKIVRLTLRKKIKITRPENISYVISTLITMTVCGMWHGSSLNFLIWGLLHGVFMVFSFITKKARFKLLSFIGFINKFPGIIIKHFVTFTLIVLSFVIFRADDLGNAFDVFWKITAFDFEKHSGHMFYNYSELVISVVVILFLLLFEYFMYKKDKSRFETNIEQFISYPLLLLLFAAVVFLGKFAEIDFLYFKF